MKLENKKASPKTSKPFSWVEQARKGHLAAPKNDPHWKESADKLSKELGRKK
jgi:hypothetical protein